MHLFVYNLKLLLRNKMMLFWTLLFPLILATLFNLAFSHLLDNEHFEIAKVAIVEVKENKEFCNVLDELSKEDDNQLLDVQYVSLNKAKDLLDNDKIDGYLVIDKEIELTINKNGISQTIIQTVVDNYYSTVSTFKNIYEIKPQTIINGVFNDLEMNKDYFKEESSNHSDLTVIYFYTLIGMNCMFGGFSSITLSTKMEGNLSRQGTRITISPIPKYKILLSSSIAIFIIHYIKMLVLLAYLIYGLNVQFGDQIIYIMLLMAIGSLVGISLGNCISCILKTSEDTKVSVGSSLSMLCSFFAGMMIIDMKYWVLEYFPLGAYINPVSLITDALYALYYYTTYDRYFFNVLCLLGMSTLLTFVSIIFMRRKQYDSI
jgi:ABC-type multidrug transport system, permease component